ncbi:hypothetical protein L6164_032211 [Bauhinia variegata]|uniref:Uncharacterized protein n=1 Tax=Bauhinia variegata TaxID=167791 RepID=A0ACB9KN41_BAUVA|nr:hypothetical protein L6164_032211 [Bauhinia variegata]
MGNCCGQPKTASSTEWGGEDWGSLTSKHKKTSSSKVFDESLQLNARVAERERALGALRASADENGKVKIRISKKELEDLLAGKTEKQQQKQKQKEQFLSAEQALLRLLNTSNRIHHRPWRPVLQSIPEVE